MIFPDEFDITEGQECTAFVKSAYLANGYIPTTCSFDAYNWITIELSSLYTGTYEFIIEDITNPGYVSASKMFQLQLFKNGLLLEENLIFSKVPFTPAPSNHHFKFKFKSFFRISGLTRNHPRRRCH